MIAARGRFLDSGHYHPLRDALAERVLVHLRTPPGSAQSVVLDAGCGDGYYLAAVLDRVSEGDSDGGDARAAGVDVGVQGYGCDISPPALRAAARRCPGATLFLNDITHGICLADSAVDVLLNVFAPRSASEFARLVRPGGLLLVVIPRERHLGEMADLLPIGMATDKRAGVEAMFAGAFDLTDATPLEYAVELSGDDVANLLAMTPGAFHGAVAGARPPGDLEVTAAFDVLSFRRR